MDKEPTELLLRADNGTCEDAEAKARKAERCPTAPGVLGRPAEVELRLGEEVCEEASPLALTCLGET